MQKQAAPQRRRRKPLKPHFFPLATGFPSPTRIGRDCDDDCAGYGGDLMPNAAEIVTCFVLRCDGVTGAAHKHPAMNNDPANHTTPTQAMWHKAHMYVQRELPVELQQ